MAPLAGKSWSLLCLFLITSHSRNQGEGIPMGALALSQSQTMTASNTTEVAGTVGGSVTFHSHSTDGNTDGNVSLWFFGNEAIVTVASNDPRPVIFFKDNSKTRFAVSENGLALTISQLRMEDAGTYSVIIGDQRSNFTLRVFRNSTHPPSPGAQSSSLVSIGCAIGALAFLSLLVIFLMICYKRAVLWMKERRRSSAGHSHGATGDRLTDGERQAEESEPEADQPFGAAQHYEN